MNYDIVSIGSATRDVFLHTQNFRTISSDLFPTRQGLGLELGSKSEVHKIAFASGGGGTNAAVTFARQGFSTACIGVIGKDSNGASILDELRREGVDAKYFQIHHDDMTAYSVVLVGDDGERTILSYKGEGTHWNVDAVPWGRLECPWMYVNSLGGHVDMLDRIIAEAQKTGRHLVTNPGSKEIDLGLDVLASRWKKFDIVGLNQEEASTLTGISFEKGDAIFHAMDEAIGGIFVMTRGKSGVSVSDGHYLYTAGIPNHEVVERTGAGDAFHSAFTAEFIRSGNIQKAIQLATANSTSVVLQYGAKAGILRKGQQGTSPLVRVEKKSLR